MGKTRIVLLVMLNSSAIWGMALLQIDEPIVLFMTCMTPAARTRNFLLYSTHQYSPVALLLLDTITHTVLQLTGFSGSLGPNETIVLEATRRNLEYEGFP